VVAAHQERLGLVLSRIQDKIDILLIRLALYQVNLSIGAASYHFEKLEIVLADSFHSLS
jgi:hypothetical protein